MIELTDDGTFDTVMRCSICGDEKRYRFDPGSPEEELEVAFDNFRIWALEDAEAHHRCQKGQANMSTRFTDYLEAAAEARTRANASGLDIAIRATTEYGKRGFNVSYASRNDSDYARAEIVKPEEGE